jgi:hypothetical protein
MVEPLLALHGEVVLREKLVDVHDEEVVLVELLQGDGFLPEPGPEVGGLRVRATLHLHLRLCQLALQYTSQCSSSGSEYFGFTFFRPPGSGSISQRYGSGSGYRSFYQKQKIVRKTWIPTNL